MKKILKINLLIKIFLTIIFSVFFFLSFLYFSKASPTKANIVIDTKKITGFINPNWKAFAQGGEEKDKRMLENVTDQVRALFPKYIRIDHIYDFYDVLSRQSNGQLQFNWSKLDQTVCDIYYTGAKPFFVLGYMPEVIGNDNSLVSMPKNWQEWSLVVQKTIERYSGKDTRLCGGVTGSLLEDIYYEVWNEPDLETFGSWSHWGGQKSYLTLYHYSVKGAENAQNVYRFKIGGPVTTAAYKNWFINLADYILKNNLRIDFISWHHYSKNPDDFYQDLQNINQWFSNKKYQRFQYLPKIISEWGYDSQPNPIAQTNIGAAHTVTAIRYMIDQEVLYGFAFEIKDGPQPSWGMLTYNGNKKPRYQAFQLLNKLDRNRLDLKGEGTFVKAIASLDYNKITLILVNYDPNNQNTELVPITFNNLDSGIYKITESRLDKEPITYELRLNQSILKKTILMPPNSIIAIELTK